MESATHVVPRPRIRQSMSYRGTEERALQGINQNMKVVNTKYQKRHQKDQKQTIQSMSYRGTEERAL